MDGTPQDSMHEDAAAPIVATPEIVCLELKKCRNFLKQDKLFDFNRDVMLDDHSNRDAFQINKSRQLLSSILRLPNISSVIENNIEVKRDILETACFIEEQTMCLNVQSAGFIFAALGGGGGSIAECIHFFSQNPEYGRAVPLSILFVGASTLAAGSMIMLPGFLASNRIATGIPVLHDIYHSNPQHYDSNDFIELVGCYAADHKGYEVKLPSVLRKLDRIVERKMPSQAKAAIENDDCYKAVKSLCEAESELIKTVHTQYRDPETRAFAKEIINNCYANRFNEEKSQQQINGRQ